MSQQERVVQLLQEACSLLGNSNQPATSSAIPCTSGSTGSSSNVRSTVRQIFAPYRTNQQGRRRMHLPAPNEVPQWTHRFFCLSRNDKEVTPTRHEKRMLQDAGLGEVKLSMPKTNSFADIKTKLSELFPKLKEAGGFQLLRSSVGNRSSLEVIRVPPAQYLSDRCGLGQAMIYVRPLQTSLSLSPMKSESGAEVFHEKCLKCGDEVPLMVMEKHLEVCGNSDSDTELQTGLPPPKKPRTDSTRPICGFACVTSSETALINSNSDEIPCPICGTKFARSVLQVHAASCGESVTDPIEAVPENMSLDDELGKLTAKVGTGEDKWLINVVRRNFAMTAFQELNDALESDWEKPIKINFVGEEGIDEGGLTREFYSLLFKTNTVFENESFHVDSGLLEKKTFLLMGKATARAILSGHPGPKCFNPLVAKFICSGEEPDLVNIPDEYIGRMDVLTAIREISSGSSGYEDLVRIHGDLLEQAGFRQVLSSSTASGAVQALKQHFAYYHVMGPLLQYREGLKLLGIQTVLQNHQESFKFFTASSSNALDIQNFYKPVYTSDDLKPREEMIIFNFGKFLKKAERGTLSTPWIDPYQEVERSVVINTGHVLQALIGCESLPRNIECGLIEFCHTSNNLSTVNTCAPSITFSQTAKIEEYEIFEKHFLSLIVEAEGFGLV